MAETELTWENSFPLVQLYLQITPVKQGSMPFEVIHGRPLIIPQLGEFIPPELKEEKYFIRLHGRYTAAQRANNQPVVSVPPQIGYSLKARDWTLIKTSKERRGIHQSGKVLTEYS